MVPALSLDKQVHPTAYRMPGPALVLALSFVLLGPSFELARWMSIVCGSLSCPLLYLLASRIVPFKAAMLAGLACAFYPTHIYNCLFVFSEPYFIPTVLLSLILTLAALQSGSLWTVLMAGAAWGVTTLIRPHGLPMAGLLAVYLLWRLNWRHVGAFLLGFSCLLAPWVLRNFVTFGRPVLLPTEGGEGMLGTNNPYVLDDPKLHGMWLYPMNVPEYRQRLSSLKDEFERDKEQRIMGIAYLRENTDKIPTLVSYKLSRWLTPVSETGGWIRLGVLCSYGLLLASLFAGLFLGVYQRSAALHLALMWTFVLFVVTCVYWGNLTRGRLPLEMIWLPWGASAVCAMLGLFARTSKAQLLTHSARWKTCSTPDGNVTIVGQKDN